MNARDRQVIMRDLMEYMERLELSMYHARSEVASAEAELRVVYDLIRKLNKNTGD